MLVLSDYGGAVVSVALGGDGPRLATISEDALVKVWELDLTVLQAKLLSSISLRADSVVMTPDGTRIALAGVDGVVRVLEPTRGRELLALSVHPGRWDVAFSPDTWGLVTTGEDGVARLWDVSPSRELFTLLGTNSGVSFSADGSLLATGTRQGAIIWDVEGSIANTSGQQVAELAADGEWVRGVAFSPDAQSLAAAGQAGTVTVWDTATGSKRWALMAHEGGVTDVAFNPSGSLLASTGLDGLTRMWGPLSGKLLLELSGHSKEVWAVAFHPVDAYMATIGWDDSLIIWDLAPVLGSIDMEGSSPDRGESASTPADMVLFRLPLDANGFDVAFSPNGERLAAGSRKGVVTVWDVGEALGSPDASGSRGDRGEPRIVHELPRLNWRITSLAFSADGERLAVGASDGNARIYDVETWQEHLTLSLHDNFINGVAFSRDGKRLVTSGADGMTRLYALDLDELTALAHQRLSRSLTDDECRRYLHLDRCPTSP
jgi:WD40 repeat protein